MANVPTATSWLLTSVGAAQQPVVRSVFMVVSKKTGQKGSAFSLSTGFLVTNEHVVRGSSAADLTVFASQGQVLTAKSVQDDEDKDLAVIELDTPVKEGFRIQSAASSIGERVHTWGYPLAYNGPSPILSVGYLAGFNAWRRAAGTPEVKHFVVNGAFNPGNSGGPLIAAVEDAVVGVVVSKHVPITQWHQSALEVLSKQQSGFSYTATDGDGNTKSFSEAQLVADLLMYLRGLVLRLFHCSKCP